MLEIKRPPSSEIGPTIFGFRQQATRNQGVVAVKGEFGMKLFKLVCGNHVLLVSGHIKDH